MIKAVLFDFDGVLAHTFPCHLRAWTILFAKRYDLNPAGHIVRIHEGVHAFKIAQAIARNHGIELDDDTAKSCAQRKNDLFRKISNAEAYREVPDIVSICRQMHRKAGLVTGTTHKNIESVLGNELLRQFDVLVREGDTQRGKPNPDPYLAACERINLDPEECLVVENAPLGIQSAKRAGCLCVALQTTLGLEHLTKADVVLKDHQSLLAMLEIMFRDG